jgi:hypothetical protein
MSKSKSNTKAKVEIDDDADYYAITDELEEKWVLEKDEFIETYLNKMTASDIYNDTVQQVTMMMPNNLEIPHKRNHMEPTIITKSKMMNHVNKHDLLIEEINARIKQEICYESLEKLTDANLMNEYKECNSVKNEIQKLGNVLEKYTNEETKQKIIEEYILILIPPGTKGVIRGNKFNNIVKQFITKLELDTTPRFEICFEKKCEPHFTAEIPDWYILEKSTNKIIIGMNQLDLWGGGHQINRGSKYLIDNKHNNENSKLLCVICNEIQFKGKKNKAYNLFETGFKNDTLCYLNNLQNIITSYFN